MSELPLPDPPLSTDSLVLWPWTDDDVPAIVAARQDPLIGRFSPVVSWPYGDGDARAWLASQEPARRSGRALELAVVALDGQARTSLRLLQAPRHRGSGWATPARTACPIALEGARGIRQRA